MQMEAACTCGAVQCIESSKLCIVGIIYNGNMGTLMDDLTSGGAGVELVQVHARLAVQLWPARSIFFSSWGHEHAAAPGLDTGHSH